jgi:integrase
MGSAYEKGWKRTRHEGTIRKTTAGRFVAEVNREGKTRRKSFADFDDAVEHLKNEAEQANNRIDTVTLSTLEMEQSKLAYEILRPLGLSADELAREANAVCAELEKHTTWTKFTEDARVAYIKLKGTGTTLTELANSHIQKIQEEAAQKTGAKLSVVFEAYLSYLRDVKQARPSSIRDKNRVKGFIDLYGDQPIATIKEMDVDSWLDNQGLSARSRKNALVALQSIFNSPKRKRVQKIVASVAGEHSLVGYKNSAAHYAKDDDETNEDAIPGTIKPDEAEKILHFIQEKNELAAVAFAVNILTGIRVEEVCGTSKQRRLDTSDLLEENGRIKIHVPRILAKGKKERKVNTPPCLEAWLGLIKKKGPLAPSAQTISRWRIEACKKHGLTFPRNAGRHTFATAYLELFTKHEAAHQLGHISSVRMLEEYYAGCRMSQAEAKALFNIWPMQRN